MDQLINDRGILVDRQLVAAAVECDLQYKDTVTARAYELTGLANPNSPAQIKGWLTDHGVEVDSLDKKAVKGMKIGGWNRYSANSTGKVRIPGYGIQRAYCRVAE